MQIQRTKIFLIYLRARYYDPSTGRFLTQDPSGDSDNDYVYCSNDPINGSDPTGLYSIGDWVFVNGRGTSDSYGEGNTTYDVQNESMMIKRLKTDGRSNPYGMSRDGVGDTGWFRPDQISGDPIRYTSTISNSGGGGGGGNGNGNGSVVDTPVPQKQVYDLVEPDEPAAPVQPDIPKKSRLEHLGLAIKYLGSAFISIYQVDFLRDGIRTGRDIQYLTGSALTAAMYNIMAVQADAALITVSFAFQNYPVVCGLLGAMVAIITLGVLSWWIAGDYITAALYEVKSVITGEQYVYKEPVYTP